MMPIDREDREARLAERRAKLSSGQQTMLEQRLRARGPQAANAQEAAPASLVAIQPTGARPPFLLCPPGRRRRPSAFRLSLTTWERTSLSMAFSSRGLGAGEEPLASLEEMAASYLARITRSPPAPTTSAAGRWAAPWSSSSPASLAAEGREVALVAVVDGTPGPWPPGEANEEEEDGEDDSRWLLDIADYLQRLWGLDLGLSPEALRALAPADQRRASWRP